MNTTDSAPAGGAAIGQVIGAIGRRDGGHGDPALPRLGAPNRPQRRPAPDRRPSPRATRGFAPWAALPVAARGRLAAGRPARHVLGHLPAHRRRPRPRSARQPGSLPDPRRACSESSPPASWRSSSPRASRAARAMRIAGDWYAPLGGVAMLAAAGFALIGFPLDDVWHRIFGQDVTLWGPTHLMLIGGAGLTLIGSCDPDRRGHRQPGSSPPTTASAAGRSTSWPASARRARWAAC